MNIANSEVGVNLFLVDSLKERSEAHSLAVSTVGHAEDTFATLASENHVGGRFFVSKILEFWTLQNHLDLMRNET